MSCTVNYILLGFFVKLYALPLGWPGVWEQVLLGVTPVVTRHCHTALPHITRAEFGHLVMPEWQHDTAVRGGTQINAETN